MVSVPETLERPPVPAATQRNEDGAAMPALVVFLGRHAAIGLALAVLFVGGLVALDVGHLGTLVQNAPDGWLAVAVLTLACTITFSSAQMGFAVMLLSAERDEDKPRGRRIVVERALRLAPVALRVPVRR